jgi:hypothetical protein
MPLLELKSMLIAQLLIIMILLFEQQLRRLVVLPLLLLRQQLKEQLQELPQQELLRQEQLWPSS